MTPQEQAQKYATEQMQRRTPATATPILRDHVADAFLAGHAASQTMTNRVTPPDNDRQVLALTGYDSMSSYEVLTCKCGKWFRQYGTEHHYVVSWREI